MSELNIQGYMRATFNPSSNKIAHAELRFNTGVVSSYINTLSHKQSTQNFSNISLPNAMFEYGTAPNTSQLNGTTQSLSNISLPNAMLDYRTAPYTSQQNGMSSNATFITYENGDSKIDGDYNT